MIPGNGSIETQARVLLDAGDWLHRAKAADALAALFCGGGLSGGERARAEELFRLTRFDGEVLVRRVLAEGLKRSAALSREIVLLYIADRAEVAAPLIECSPVLDDADLLRILREESSGHRMAVARRHRLSEPVSQPILSSGDEPLIVTLLQNPGAAIADCALFQLAQARPLRPPLAEALARRRALPSLPAPA